MGVPAPLKDEVRDLIANGWTPPTKVLEPYRHILKAYYAARGWGCLPGENLDRNDCDALIGLLAMFDHFGLPIPEAPRDAEAA